MAVLRLAFSNQNRFCAGRLRVNLEIGQSETGISMASWKRMFSDVLQVGHFELEALRLPVLPDL
jgi:hypothetical protein